MKNYLLEGNVDLHVHSHPDIRERAYTDFDLMNAGIKSKSRAIVIKSHHGYTMNRAYLVNEHNRIVNGDTNNFEMFGGIVLNYGVGGLSPLSTENAIKLGAKIVWFPTIHAANHMKKYGKTGGISCLANGEVTEETIAILEIIKKYDVIMATGHLGTDEIFKVVEKAKEMGIDKIVINHPEFWVIGMTHEEQVEIVEKFDVYLERCYAQPMGGGVYKSNLQDNLEIIKKVGYKNVIVDTDGGQVENPHWEIAFSEYVEYLLKHGITEEEIREMTVVHGQKLLGIK